MARARKTQPARKTAEQKPKPVSPPLTADQAEERGGELVNAGKTFKCGIGKCEHKTTHIKNTKKDVGSHRCKHHGLELNGKKSAYEIFVEHSEPGFERDLCPTCYSLHTSGSTCDSHRRRDHGHRSPPEANAPQTKVSEAKTSKARMTKAKVPKTSKAA